MEQFVDTMVENPVEVKTVEAKTVADKTEVKSENQVAPAPKRMLFRSPDDKLIGGVCGGLADFTGWDPSLVRILWVVLTLATGGGGVLAYVALLILLPVGSMDEGQVRPAALELNEKNLARTAFILIGLGGLWLLANLGILPALWGGMQTVLALVFWPALLIGVGYVLLRYTGRGMRWNVNDAATRVKSEVNGKMPTKEGMKSGMRQARQQFPLKRSRTDRIFMGVCGGIAQKLGIDANLVRLIWAAFSIGSIGMGVLIYVLLGLFLPEERPVAMGVGRDEPREVKIIDVRAG